MGSRGQVSTALEGDLEPHERDREADFSPESPSLTPLELEWLLHTRQAPLARLRRDTAGRPDPPA